MEQSWLVLLHWSWYIWDSCLWFQWMNLNFGHRLRSILTQLFERYRWSNFSTTYAACCSWRSAICFWIEGPCRQHRCQFLSESSVHIIAKYSCKLLHEGHRKFSEHQPRFDHQPLSQDPKQWIWKPVAPLSCILGCPFYSTGLIGLVYLMSSLLLKFECYLRSFVAFGISHLVDFLA